MSGYELGKIWIVGAEGMVGTAFSHLLDLREVELLKTDMEDVDITKREDVDVYADINRPDVIINCAGMTNLEKCEANKELAYKVNALGARNLSVAARRINAKMVQISTDDVFAGKTEEPYNEFDKTEPITVYGKSKLAGENFVKELVPKHLIIRSSWVYGAGRSNSFVNYVINAAMKNEEILVPDMQFAAPTSARAVAKVILNLLEEEAYGIYHACCTGYCSRYELADKIVKSLGSSSKIKKVQSSAIPQVNMRPAFCILDDLMLRISGMEEPVSWEQALETYLEKNNYIRKN